MKKLLAGVLVACLAFAATPFAHAASPPTKPFTIECPAFSAADFAQAVDMPICDFSAVVDVAADVFALQTAKITGPTEAKPGGQAKPDNQAPKPEPAPSDSGGSSGGSSPDIGQLISNPPPSGSPWYVYVSYGANVLLALLALIFYNKSKSRR